MKTRTIRAADACQGMALKALLYQEFNKIVSVRSSSAGLYTVIELDDGSEETYRNHVLIEVAP